MVDRFSIKPANVVFASGDNLPFTSKISPAITIKLFSFICRNFSYNLLNTTKYSS